MRGVIELPAQAIEELLGPPQVLEDVEPASPPGPAPRSSTEAPSGTACSAQEWLLGDPSFKS